MSEEIPPVLSMPRKKTQASKLRRDPARPTVQLTARDLGVLEDLAYLRLVPGAALYLLAASHGDTPLKPYVSWKERETKLWRARLLTRLYAPKSFYTRGGAWPLLTLESLVGAAIDAKVDVATLRDDVRRDIALRAAADREALLQVLASCGVEHDYAVRILERNAVLAQKFASGVTSTAPHICLAATFAALLWYGFRARGVAVTNRKADGFFKLRFVAPPGHTKAGASGVIEPDLFFTVPHADGGLQGYALEAETGSHGSAGKLEEKIEAYRLFASQGVKEMARQCAVPEMRAFRVLFIAKDDAFADRILAAIRRVFPRGTQRILVASAEYFHLNYPQEDFRANPCREDTDNLPLYTGLASLIELNAFRQIGRGGEIERVPLATPFFFAQPAPRYRHVVDIEYLGVDDGEIVVEGQAAPAPDPPAEPPIAISVEPIDRTRVQIDEIDVSGISTRS